MDANYKIVDSDGKVMETFKLKTTANNWLYRLERDLLCNLRVVEIDE